VVIVFEPGRVRLDDISVGQAVRFGESIGATANVGRGTA
jgi:hypothetical protein